ncbi:MAG: flagellar export protein FliJ, partial [Devosia sp.]|nr:flagellar export protein FliJ [Devosia sp.]
MKSRSESLIRLKKFNVDEKRRQVMQIEMMVADFERMATELDQQIEIEQTKTGISDVAHFAYSSFAKAALQRRDK